MKFHVTLEHDQPGDDPKKKTRPQPKTAPQPAAPPAKPKKVTSNKNVSPPTQANPKGAQTVKRTQAAASRAKKGNTPAKKAPVKNTGATKSPPKGGTKTPSASGVPTPANKQAAATSGQSRTPQPGPLLGSRGPTPNGNNPPGNPMEQVANHPAGSYLPPTPPKEPPANPVTQAMRSRQSGVLKKRQARELAGNNRGAPREADASSGFWPPLII
jgi:hypothetical protein